MLQLAEIPGNLLKSKHGLASLGVRTCSFLPGLMPHREIIHYLLYNVELLLIYRQISDIDGIRTTILNVGIRMVTELGTSLIRLPRLSPPLLSLLSSSCCVRLTSVTMEKNQSALDKALSVLTTV